MSFESLLAGIRRKQVAAPAAARCRWSPPAGAADLPPESALHYEHRDPAHGIDFQVQRLPLSDLQVMDPRLVRIAPGAANECHRHAHESIFVVVAGRGEIRIGTEAVAVATGDVACVPRWVVHQSRNTSPTEELLLLAITDFGLTSAVLGDYDSRTRLKGGGADAFAPSAAGGSESR
jgi:mannose-6-phosphate isomerase-like protein (cupin superfamily)